MIALSITLRSSEDVQDFTEILGKVFTVVCISVSKPNVVFVDGKEDKMLEVFGIKPDDTGNVVKGPVEVPEAFKDLQVLKIEIGPEPGVVVYDVA